jgi:hypothetical protein
MSGNSGTSRPHVETCPRRGLLCECRDCLPPLCLCALVRACQGDDAEAVRIAFYAAVWADKS